VQTSRRVGYALAWLEEGRGRMPKKSRIERLRQKLPQVLVVELVRQSGHRIRQALPESEYSVVELSSPNAGRRQLTLRLPALTFVSTVHGADAMYVFCRDVARRGVPVVVLQDAPTKASVTQAARCGAVAVMVAPPPQEKIYPRVKQLLGAKKSEADKGARKPEEVPKLTFPDGMKSPRARVEFVVMKAQTLLALPHAVSAVLRICSEPGSSAADLVAPIQTDSAISASVFRLVNSAAMSGRHRVTDLRNAVARLGTKATSNLATAQSVFKMFEQRGNTFGFDRTEYWIHSLGVACCARALAGVGNKVDPDDAFLAGLLHDLGKMVLDEYVPTDYQEAVKHANLEGTPVREGERHVFDVEHAYVGRKIAGHWGLPDRLVQAVANHHHYDVLLKDADPAEPEEFQALALAQCTCLANQLAKAFGFGHAGDFFVEHAALALWEKLNGAELDIPHLYDRVRKDLGGFLDSLTISAKDLGLGLADPGTERVLVWLPERQSSFRPVVEAFVVRCGYTPVTQSTLEHVGPQDGPFVLGITSVSGTRDDVKQAGASLMQHVPAAVLFADSPEITRDGLDLDDRTIAFPMLLDFHALREHVEKQLARPETEG